MKPTPQDKIPSSPINEHRPVADRPGFPLTDYAFQTTTLETAVFGKGVAAKARDESRTFRKISRTFIESEARREYKAEAFFFGWIVLTASWPLGVLVHQLTSMMIRY